MSNTTFATTGFLPQTEAYATQVAKAGSYPSSHFLSNLDVLIRDLIRYNIWQQLDRLWIFANESQAAAKISIVNPYGNSATWSATITTVNSPNFYYMQGFAGNGSTSYLNTQYAPFTTNTGQGRVHYFQNSTSYGFYLVSGATSGTIIDMGILNSNDTNMEANINGQTVVYINENGTGNGLTFSATGNKGFYSASRISAGANSVMMYFNGQVKGTSSNASTATPTGIPFICCRSSAGAPQDFSNRTYAMAYYSSGIVGATMSIFYNVWQKFATKMGFNV